MHGAWNILRWLVLALAAAPFGFYLLSIWSAVSFFRRREPAADESFAPPISILKPCRGLDREIYENFASFCRQDYPQYEIIFALQDYNDPAYMVARKVKEKYPDRDISILVERCDEGFNPKVNNLIPAYRMAKYQHLLISDSNVMVDRGYLREITKSMNEPGVGLVSNLIRGMGARSLGSIFENLHMNSFVMGSVCFLDKFMKMPCVVGKSMLMKKSDLEFIGGLEAFRDVLAEDYMIGKRMTESGKKVVLSSHMISNVNHYWGIRKFINRHTRWGKLRWKIGGMKYLSELVGNSVFMSALPMILWQPSKISVSFTLLVCLLKTGGDYYIGRRTQSELHPFLYFLVPVKDILIGLIWLIPIISNTVNWRGNRYIIGKDSVLSSCPEAGIWSWRYRFVDAIMEKL